MVDENALYKQTFQQLFMHVARDAANNSSPGKGNYLNTNTNKNNSNNAALETLRLSLQSVDSEIEKIKLKSLYVVNHFNKINSM